VASTKLFNNLTDDEVNSQIDMWRDLSYKLTYYDTYFNNGKSANVEKYKKVIDNVRKLRYNPYKNPRKELARWRELYKILAPKLRLIRRNACSKGIKLIDKASCLYTNRKLTTPVTFTLSFDVEHLVGFDANDLQNYDVVLKGKTTGVTVTNTKVYFKKPESVW
jgi:hypothetical protein